MEAWIIAMINRFGYLRIGSLIALETVFPPLCAGYPKPEKKRMLTGNRG